MFVYLLIVSEFILLYTVFWYLYMREARVNRRIKGSMWGTYEDRSAAHQYDPTLPYAGEFNDIHPGLVDIEGEYVLDTNTNHFVPAEEAKGLLRRMARSVDRSFSRLNVKP